MAEKWAEDAAGFSETECGTRAFWGLCERLWSKTAEGGYESQCAEKNAEGILVDTKCCRDCSTVTVCEEKCEKWAGETTAEGTLEGPFVAGPVDGEETPKGPDTVQESFLDDGGPTITEQVEEKIAASKKAKKNKKK
jgi:hypothetical protein